MNVDLCLSEDKSLGAAVHGLFLFFGHPTFAAPVIVASATAKDIAQHVAVVHLHTCCAGLVYLGNRSFRSIGHGACRCRCVCFQRSSPDGAYLTAAIYAATHYAAVNLHVCIVHIAIGHISTAKDVATVIKLVVALCFVIEFLHIVIAALGVSFVSVSYATVVYVHMGCTVDGTTLATAIDVAGDGRYAVDMARTAGVANDNVGIAEDVVGVCCNIANESIRSRLR